MKLLVCVKQVPETADVQMEEETHVLRREGVAMICNPADESALEAALQCKARTGAQVTVMTMGKPSAAAMLRDLGARGADRLVLLTDPAFAGADTYATAQTLHAAVIAGGGFDLILCGRRAIDGETGQVGPALSALLSLPCITNVMRWQQDGVCERLLEDGVETLAFETPAVLTFCEYTYPLRLPSIVSLRRAKQLEVETFTQARLASAVCGLSGSPTRVQRVQVQRMGVRNAVFAAELTSGAERLYEMMREARKEAMR